MKKYIRKVLREYWYDYEDSKGFDKEVYDSESQEKEVISIREV